jgi:hypothetical protein
LSAVCWLLLCFAAKGELAELAMRVTAAHAVCLMLSWCHVSHKSLLLLLLLLPYNDRLARPGPTGGTCHGRTAPTDLSPAGKKGSACGHRLLLPHVCERHPWDACLVCQIQYDQLYACGAGRWFPVQLLGSDSLGLATVAASKLPACRSLKTMFAPAGVPLAC